MNKSTQNQMGSVTGWVIAAVVIIAVGAYFLVKHSNPSAPGVLQPGQVTIMVPSDLDTFAKAAIAHVQVGGPDPVPTTTFVTKIVTPNTIVNDPLQNIAEAAAEYIQTQAGTSSLVTYLKVMNGTAYVVLNMDENGWAGVSAAIAQVHPIVEKSLLNQPGITAVTFGRIVNGPSIAIVSPNGGEHYKVGDVIDVRFNGYKIPSDAILIANIVGESKDMPAILVQNGLKKYTDKIDVTIPSQSCYEDACENIVAGNYKVHAVVYSSDILKLRCINSPYCHYPESNILAEKDSDNYFTITKSVTNPASNLNTSDWKTYANADVGILFKYPAYFGDVILDKLDPNSCPEMKTYSPEGILLSGSYQIRFSKQPSVGTGKSSMEAYITIANGRGSNSTICGTDLQLLMRDIGVKSISGSVQFNHDSATQAYKSAIVSTIGTSADQFYTLFKYDQSADSIKVIQSDITFIPSAYTTESKDIQATTGSSANDQGWIVKYVNENQSQSATQIRSYFKDFQALASSIKFTN